MAAKSPTPAGVDAPYDWSDYRSDFVPSPAYEAQEAALRDLLTALPPPASVLEVGPGFGRVTKILTQLWPSEDNANQPPTKFAIADLSEAAIEQTSAACPQIDFAYEVLPLPDGLASRRPFPSRTFDLVVAVEVLLHIPPSSVQQAVNHLLSCLKPARQPTRAHGVSPAATTLAKGQGSGVLITCDWTQPLPSSTPIRNQNFCHDYQDLFAHSKLPATIVAAVPTGLQTIFVVTRGG